MTTGKRRIEKLETGLTPKQVFMLWLQDAHTFNDIKEYVQSLKDQMESAAPIPRLTDQVEAAVKQRLKGQPKEEIHKAVRQAYKDVLFLFFLHQQVNGKLYTEERYFWTRGMLLLTELKSLMREQALDRRMRWKAVKIALDMPYPLDSETAAAVEAAKEHYVMTWEMLEESDDLGEWVTESFLTNGKNSLPEGAYGMMSGATPGDSDTKDLFQNAVEFQKFLDGEDYSYGLADVTDAEYNAHYEAIVSAVKGVVPEGVVVELPTVPNQFLTDAPLVDGDWIDRYVVELAEWGARMVEKGYLLEVPEDQHPLAWHRIIDPEGGCEANAVVTEKLWQQTRKHISGFPGRTKEIDGRQYLSFTDYLKWRGRHAKGDLTSGIDTGMVVADWNRWVEEHGGEGAATLSEVGVGKLDCHLDGYCFRVCLDAAKLAEEVGRRESLSETVQVGNPGGGDDEDPFRRRVERWKGLALGFLPEIYALRGAIDSINQRYFDGQQILFPAVVEGFDQLVALVEKTVDIYNDSLAEDIERLETLLEGQGESPLTIDRTGLVEAVRGAVVDQVAYLVDMAKAEALDMLGDTRQALKLVNLYA